MSNKTSALFFFGWAALVSVYGFINAFWLRVSHVTVALAGLPAGWAGQKVALVTDLHLGNVRGAGFCRRIVKRLNQLQPKMVLIGGDLFDGVKLDGPVVLAAWRGCHPPGGVYYVTGNHEEFTNREIFIDTVASAGIRVLRNEKVEVDGLPLIGLLDDEATTPARCQVLLEQMRIDPRRATLLLARQPSCAPLAAKAGVALQLSGHTHGGQFWPWNLVTARVHGILNHGLVRLDGLQLFTSYGVGTWGAPMRVGTKSEIVLLRFENASVVNVK